MLNRANFGVPGAARLRRAGRRRGAARHLRPHHQHGHLVAPDSDRRARDVLTRYANDSDLEIFASIADFADSVATSRRPSLRLYFIGLIVELISRGADHDLAGVRCGCGGVVGRVRRDAARGTGEAWQPDARAAVRRRRLLPDRRAGAARSRSSAQGQGLRGFNREGTTAATVAGALGALGAVCIIFSFRTGGTPTYVMPLVFGGAPLVNVLYTMYIHPPKSAVSPMLYLGFLRHRDRRGNGPVLQAAGVASEFGIRGSGFVVPRSSSPESESRTPSPNPRAPNPDMIALGAMRLSTDRDRNDETLGRSPSRSFRRRRRPDRHVQRLLLGRR